MVETLPFGQALGDIMQVAYVVDDVQKAMLEWRDKLQFGPWFLFEHFELLDLTYRGQPSDVDISIALGFSGSMCFELIQQNNDVPSIYKDVIDARGYGFHHWAISTLSFDEDVKRYEALGAELALSAMVPVGARAAVMDTTDSLGGMLELIEVTPKVEEFFTMMHKASVGWNGADPVRVLT